MKTKIETERLTLRLTTDQDLEEIHYLLTFPEVDRYNTLGIPTSIEKTLEIMQPLFDLNVTKEKYTFGVIDKITNQFIGMAGIVPGKPNYKSAEVWYKFIPEVWGKGFATEVLKAMIQFCFKTLNLHRVEAGCAVKNIASIRVLEKSGMKLEGRRRETLPLRSGWSDNFEYAILETDLIS